MGRDEQAVRDESSCRVREVNMSKKMIRIAGASGFWGDAARATPQLLKAGGLDFIVYDYLAEITMSIMARARMKDPQAGYATDFVTTAMKPNLIEIARQGVRVISNAGGVNPRDCVIALEKIVAELGLDLKIACVVGDDLYDRRDGLSASGVTEMFSDDSFPAAEKVQSINAYLGAFPIADALSRGADIVVTGRCVDSAVTLGACIHSFGWKPGDLDLLAMGSLAGHILECGPQATGGNFTDWELVAERIDEIGYPIAEIAADGTFDVVKPEDTGGVVNRGTVAEQMLYEIGDPQAYMLPDVVCDFSQVIIEETGHDRVHVSGARGYPAPDSYKVCVTYADGFRGGTVMTFYGLDAEKKAEAYAAGAFRAARRSFRAFNMPDFTETSVELIGAESQFGTARTMPAAREVAAKIAAKHPSAAGIGLLLKECVGLGLATPPGLSGFAGGRAKPSPIMRLFSFLISKSEITIEIEMGGEKFSCADAVGTPFNPATLKRPAPPAIPAISEMVEVPLISLAWARSGDKGNNANIGIIARKPEALPWIWKALTPEIVAVGFAHFLEGSVERFLLPGTQAVNFLLHDVLGGGGVASIRNDPQAKGYSQLLLSMTIPVPHALAEALPRNKVA